jgi:hypothetical protein
MTTSARVLLENALLRRGRIRRLKETMIPCLYVGNGSAPGLRWIRERIESASCRWNHIES